MKNVFLKYVILIFGIISFSGCYSSKKIQLESNNTYVIPNLISTSDTIYLLIEEIGLKSPIPLIVSDTFNINMGNEGKEYKLIFKEEKDSILLEYKGRNSEKAVINKGDISLLVNINYGGAEAVFSKDYKLAYDGKVTIEIPKVYELINIVFTISKLDSLYPGKINWDNKYSYDVRDHFNKYKRHDLIRLVDKEIANNYSFYRNLRANSYAYRFDGNNIISKRIYTRISEGPDLLKELIPLLQDFAVKSDFLSFYQTNANYFNNLIKNYNKNIPVNEMWQWLETMFPNKVNSYKLILSPLVGNHHFTMKFKYNGFIETLMFINVIDIQNISKINVGNISRQIFTEIDHNYVNPATKVLDKQILNSMSDYKKWNSSSVYSSSIKTINEYMTWGTFTLFAWEFFEKSVFEQINLNTELIMVKSRGFTKFDLFNQELLRLYIEKSGDKSANNLFSDIISWMNSQDD